MTMLLLRRLHRWIGLALALPLVVMGASGCVLAAALLFECCHVQLGADAPADHAMQIPAIVAAAREAAPAGATPRRIHLTPGEAAIVYLALPHAQMPTLRASVDPVSLHVLDLRESGGGFVRWVRNLHESFLLGAQGGVGRGVVGWCGVGLLVLGLSGIPLWWPKPGRWRAAVTVSRGSSGLRLQRELHGAAGAWALALLLLQSVSGAALAFPQTARAIAGLPPQFPQGARRDAPQAEIDATPVLGAAVAAALRAVPDAALHDIRLPASAGRPMIAFLLPRGQWEGAPEAAVLLDPTTGRIRSVSDPRSQGWGGWLLGWLRALHYGGGLGLGWRLVSVASGLVLPLFPLTGLAMWLLRRRNRIRLAARREAAMMMSAGQ
jgi:uncharacterized iron-regulated membrane protein